MLIISGTNRSNSKSIQLAELYKEIFQTTGINAEILNLEDIPADFIRSALYDNLGKSNEFNKLQMLVDKHDKVVIIVPEYNGSFPGILKTFIDGLKHPNSFRGKKGALVGISAGAQGGGLALSHLTDILNYMGMHILAIKPKLSSIDSNMKGNTLTNPIYLNKVREHVEEFIKF